MNKQSLTPRQMRMVEGNLGEYPELSNVMRFLSSYEAIDAERKRGELIASYRNQVDFLFSQTKPAFKDISPGCRICGEGGWSCLFINGKCNCRCFYCPTTQNEISVPTTNRVPFSDARSYSDYVTRFGFTGVSISGGEPLLTPEKTIRFIETLRKDHGDGLHIWMYTNGSLVTAEIIHKLKHAGLNEIRFDISARDYALDKLALAVGRIPVITVEIPAIPEDISRLSEIIPVMHDTGVNHLNLHQLRLTPHNSRFLLSRNYTYLHGPKVTVLDSELTALTLLKKACENSWALPINYCSFTYKNQYQQAATRKKCARFIVKPHESITETGMIRTLMHTGTSPLTQTADILTQVDPNKTLWQISSDKLKLIFHPDLWPHVDTKATTLTAAYAETILSPGLSYRNPFKEVLLSTGMKLYAEKINRSKHQLNPEDTAVFEKRVIQNDMSPIPGEAPDFLDDEFILPGLQTYF